MPSPTCRACGASLTASFVDLGLSPLCQTHIRPDAVAEPETFYPLHALICDKCWLVQLGEFATPAEIFTEYAYFSSYSTSWVEHARRYAEAMIGRLDLGSGSRVVEIASNDGYLLQHFAARAIPVLGVEPAANVAKIAIDKGIPTDVAFFGRQTAERLLAHHGPADLLLGNNVLAHVPDLNDFIAGLKAMLAPAGAITMEFPHLLRLIEGNQFDTIYHEHFSYFSLLSVEQAFARHRLTLFDVEELPTHGGSLRIFVRHADASGQGASAAVQALRRREVEAQLDQLAGYAGFRRRVERTKHELLSFLIDAKRRGKRIAGYGAPGKGNTLLNYCAIRSDFLDFTVDANPYKQGTFTPGTRIPILPPDAIRDARPDYVLILPWNLREEISRAAAYIRDWGGQFVVPIPRVEVF